MSEHIPPRRGRPPREIVYRRLDAQIAELWQRLGGLPSPIEAQDIWKGIWFEEAHHSTAIEGNTLVLKQVEALLAEGLAIGNKELAEYMEVRGYADAADWVYQQAITPAMASDEGLLTPHRASPRPPHGDDARVGRLAAPGRDRSRDPWELSRT